MRIATENYITGVFTMKDWLKCDLHIHTDMSDGHLTTKQVIDLYGEHKFDVIALTDHMTDIPRNHRVIAEDEVKDYFDHVTYLKNYAWMKYHMVLMHGLELGNYTEKWHILALDINRSPKLSWNLEDMLDDIRSQGGLSIAAHPGRKASEEQSEWHSQYLWEHMDELRGKFDAWEVANRDDLYNFTGIKKRKFNIIAGSDFHKKKHIYSWKTALKAERNTIDIKQAIRKNTDVAIYLYRR